MTQRRWGANNAELHRESRLAARESEERGRLDAAVAGPWGYSVVSLCKCVRACHEGRRQGERDKRERGAKAEKGQRKPGRGPEAGGFWWLCPFLSIAARCLSVSAGYCQLHPAIGKSTRGVVLRNGDGVDCRNKKGRAKWREASVGACPGAGRDRTGGSRGNWRRSASGPGAKWGSKVGRQSIHCGTVGQWDSGTGTVAVACRPARKREIGEVLPPRPLPRFQRQAAGPVSRPPSDRRVHVCTKHQAANAEAAHAQAHDNKRNHRTVSVKKPLLPLEFWTSSIGRVCSAGDGVSFRSFRFPRDSCQTPNLDRQIAPVRLVRGIPELQQKNRVETGEKGLMAGLCRVCEYGLTIESVLQEGISQWFEAASQI